MQLLTRKEAATILRVELTTLDRYVKNGQLACYHLPGGKRFDHEQLRTLITKGGTGDSC